MDVAGDCDDGDPQVHPGGTELCNGEDDDCDGEVDEGAADAPPWHPDLDGDERGDADTTEAACTAPDGWIADDSDCDDTCPTCWTGAVEACGDGVDNDCDGVNAGECALSGELPLADAPVVLRNTGNAESVIGSPGDVDGDGLDDMLLPDRGGGWLVTDFDEGERTRGASESWVCGSMGCLGNSASVAARSGDADGDGRPDVLFSQAYTGAWIVSAPPAGESNAASIAETTFTGGVSYPEVVDWAGDVNGDGATDVLIGTHGSSSDQPWRAHLVEGPFRSQVDLGTEGVSWLGVASADGGSLGFGLALAGVGDVSGDGLDDVAVGAHGAGHSEGAMYVYLGGDPVSGTSDDADVTLWGDASDGFAREIAAAGDTDGDGIEDILVSSYSAGAWLVSGGALASGLADTVATGRITPDSSVGSLGSAIAGGGDVNGDGRPDLLVGAYSSSHGALSGAGEALLYYSPLVGVQSPDGAVARLYGEATNEYAGNALSLAEDVNGDGFADPAIAATAYTGELGPGGAVFVLLGGID